MRPFLIASLMLTAAPSLATPLAAGPVVRNGVEITILQPTTPASGPPGVVEVTLDVEARSDEAASRLGYRSMRGVTAVDCRVGANRFIKADAYAVADLRGPATPRVVSGEWVKPAAESYMSPITARVCGVPPPTTTAASGPLPVVKMGTETAAAPTPPPLARTPVRLAMATSPRSAASTPPAVRAKADGRGVAQVAASSTAQGAQHVLDRLHALISPPLTASVEPATVNNAPVFRASVTGFVSLGDAQAFCARAASVSKTCWVHWKAAGNTDGAPRAGHRA